MVTTRLRIDNVTTYLYIRGVTVFDFSHSAVALVTALPRRYRLVTTVTKWPIIVTSVTA